ncbi:MAG: hypothetical protein F6K19_49195 [Cyanothece sp. SIO1E1]|nr:hypothetical protein [Cyanothece sp. SIO1E1]
MELNVQESIEKRVRLSDGTILIRTEEGIFYQALHESDLTPLLIDEEEAEVLLIQTVEQLQTPLEDEELRGIIKDRATIEPIPYGHNNVILLENDFNKLIHEIKRLKFMERLFNNEMSIVGDLTDYLVKKGIGESGEHCIKIAIREIEILRNEFGKLDDFCNDLTRINENQSLKYQILIEALEKITNQDTNRGLGIYEYYTEVIVIAQRAIKEVKAFEERKAAKS